MNNLFDNYPYPVKEYMANKLNDLVDDYFQKHSKVLVVRADIRYPTDYDNVQNNSHIQKCMANTVKSFQRRGLDPAYMWVREQDTSAHPHYHCIFLLNGRKTRSSGMVFDKLEKNWGTTIGSESKGLIDHCNKSDGKIHENGMVINRNDGIPEYANRQMGYIVKPAGKGDPKDGLRDFGMSRLSKNKK